MTTPWLLLLCLTLQGQAPAMFRGGPEHPGVYASPAPALRFKWKVRTGGKVFASPAVHAGVVFVGSGDGVFHALDARDGAERWRFRAGGAVRASAAVAGGLVYFSSLDGFVYALEEASGKLRWKFRTGGESRFTAPGIHGAIPRTEMMPDPFDVFLSSPALAGGILYVGSGDHGVYALDALTGALRWRFATGDVVHASPAVAGGVVYVGSWDRNFYALDAATGGLKWKFQTGDDPDLHNQMGIASSAAVAGGMVFFGCRDSFFYALDAATGAERWRNDNHKGWVIASPAVAGGRVYFPTSDGTRFKALEAATGKPVFDVATKAISFSSPALASGVAYFGTSDGWLHGVDVALGTTIAEFQTEGSKENGPKYLDAKGAMNSAALYPDFTLDGMVIGVERTFSMGSVLSSPVVVDGVVLFGSTDGYVYALD